MHDEPYTPKLCECGCGQRIKKGRVPSEDRAKRYLRGHSKRKSLAMRFSENIQGVEPGDLSPNGTPNCVLWTGNTGGGGRYGTVKKGAAIGPGTYQAHVAAWVLSGRTPPEGEMQIDHICNRTLCVNVYHLQVLTPAENRQRSDAAKLDPDKVRAIRLRYAAGESSASLGAEYGVQAQNIIHVVRRRTWKNVD